MTLTEKMDELLALEWVGWVSDPETIETKPDGTAVVMVNLREEVEGQCTYRNVTLYVTSPGESGEEAYYKDSAPKISLPRTAFRDFVEENLPVAAPQIVAWRSFDIDEDVRKGVIRATEMTETGLVLKSYAVIDNEGELVAMPINGVSADVLASVK
jgi:hypothetical protein